MPRGQPFTRMCQLLARPRHYGRADLHLHTTASDGNYSPAELLDLARRSGLAAMAVTDHDTLEGGRQTLNLRRAGDPAVILGVEISVTWQGRDLHLLAYGMDGSDEALLAGLAAIRQRRVTRLLGALNQIRARGLEIPDMVMPTVPGRRHLAQHLVATGHVATVQQGIRRWLLGGAGVRLDAFGMPLPEAVEMVVLAGGFCSLAHPPEWIAMEQVTGLAGEGVQALEAEYPDFSAKRVAQLKTMAAAAGMSVTGGSDCHGPGPRAPGCRSLSQEDFLKLPWNTSQWNLKPEEKACWEPSGKN